MREEEGTTNCESGGDQSKEIDPVNVSLQSCRKIGWKIKIDILEGGIGFLYLLKRPPHWGGDLKGAKCKELKGAFFWLGVNTKVCPPSLFRLVFVLRPASSVLVQVGLCPPSSVPASSFQRPPSILMFIEFAKFFSFCLLYTSPSPRDRQKSRMPSSA